MGVESITAIKVSEKGGKHALASIAIKNKRNKVENMHLLTLARSCFPTFYSK